MATKIYNPATKIFPLVASWLPNEEVNFEPWISARKTKHLDVTTMFTYSHAHPLGQSEHAYYLSYYINVHTAKGSSVMLKHR